MLNNEHSSPALRSISITAFLVLLISLSGQGCSQKPSTPLGHAAERNRAVPVHVSKVAQKDVPVYVQSVGSVEAYSTVLVKSQVSGELTRSSIQEGDFVKKGQELFNIDSRTYRAQLNQVQANLTKDEAVLNQAEANLARDLAQQKYAQAEAARYSALLEKQLVSRSQAEQAKSSAEAATAAVRADQAAIQSARATVDATKAAVANARVMLSYTTIQSPLDGRTGNLDVTVGNVVNSNMTLTSINQIEPIYVTFSIPEAQLSYVRKGQAVTVDNQENSLTEKGKLSFIDNTVDSSTGTIRLKALFTNKDHKLWPGEFVQVTLKLSTMPHALIIPNQALQTGQDGSFVFVVKTDRTVESRPVTPGMLVGQDVVIEKGLNAGETVVTEGQLRLAAGSRVRFAE